jgi:hypothetical protein
MRRDRTVAARQRVLDCLPVTGELLRGSLLTRTVRPGGVVGDVALEHQEGEAAGMEAAVMDVEPGALDPAGSTRHWAPPSASLHCNT